MRSLATHNQSRTHTAGRRARRRQPDGGGSSHVFFLRLDSIHPPLLLRSYWRWRAWVTVARRVFLRTSSRRIDKSCLFNGIRRFYALAARVDFVPLNYFINTHYVTWNYATHFNLIIASATRVQIRADKHTGFIILRAPAKKSPVLKAARQTEMMSSFYFTVLDQLSTSIATRDLLLCFTV